MPSYQARIVGALIAAVLISNPQVPRANDPPPAAKAPSVTVGAPVPTFQPGLWEFKRTLTSTSGKPQVSSLRKCANPTADIEQKIDALKKKNCRFTPLRQSEGRYTSSWTCPTPTGLMTFRDMLTTRDATAYLDVNEVRMGSRVTQQKIEAQRLGECTQGAVSPLIMEPPRSAPGHSEPEHSESAVQPPPG